MADKVKTGAAAAVGAAALAAGSASLYAGWNAERIAAAHPPRGRFVEVDGTRIHVYEAGPADGPPVLFLHGNGACLDDMLLSGLIDACADRYRCIVPDRPGYGHTPRPSGRTWGPREQAALMTGLLAETGHPRALVVGHSWGSLIGLAMALEDDVAGAVLLSGFYFPEDRRDFFVIGLPATPVIGPALVWTLGPPLARRAVPRMTARMFEPQALPERIGADYPFAFAERPGQILAATGEMAIMNDAAGELGRRLVEVALPVALLHGACDKAIDPSHAERAAAIMPQASLRILPDLGHMIHYFAHDAIRAALDAVADRAAPRSSGATV